MSSQATGFWRSTATHRIHKAEVEASVYGKEISACQSVVDFGILYGKREREVSVLVERIEAPSHRIFNVFLRNYNE
jgi:hypothetical protein